MTAYEIKIVQKEDRKDIVQFLRDHFMKDEPINTAINLINEEKPVNEPLERFLLRDLENGVCLKAIQNGNLIGICVNSFMDRRQEEEHVEKSDDEGFNKIVNFLAYIDKHSDPFRKFPESSRAITVGVVAVHPSCRGMGIATKLMEQTWHLGKQHQCGFMTVECSSYYTAKALEKLGFQVIYRLNYKDYIVNDEIVFKTRPPHLESTVYIKKIQ